MNVNITAPNHAKSNLGRWMRLLTWTTVLAVLAGVLPLQPGMAGIASNGGSFANDGAQLLANPTGARYVSATINSLVSDIPAGKIYVGGDFLGISDASTSVDRENFVRLLSDGTIDASFAVTTGDTVRTMMKVDGDLYVGGDFSSDGTEDSWDGSGAFRSSRLLRINRTTGAINRAWVPSSLSNVYSMAYVTGTTNYLFAGMSGSGYLKALNVITGSTYVTISDYDDTVRALAWDGNYLYVGGEQFGTNGKPDYLRRYTFDGATFTYDTVWQPTVANSGLFDDWVRAMLIHDGYLYVAGDWNDPGGNGEQEALVRIPLTSTTGVIDPDWIPGIESNIYALAVSGNLLYTGGNDNDYHGALRYVLGSGTPVRDVDFNPAFSFAQTTGIPAAPSSDDYKDVNAILPLTTTVLYGGDFATVNGVLRPGGLAMVSSSASTVPNAPTMSAPSGSGSGPYTFSGTAQEGVRVWLYDGESVVSSTVVPAGGAWSFTTSGNLAVGEHVFVARTQPVYEIGLPTLLPTAESAPYTLTVGGASSAVGATYVVTFSGSGQNGSLKILQAGGADLINVYDPVSLSPKDSTNSRSLNAPGAAPVNSAQLIVMGYDIDWPTGEWDYVYLNGHELGRLTGASNTWNATVFDIPDLSWVNDGANTLQFKVTAYGETHYDHWTANIAGVTLLIDGGAGDRATLQSLEAPLPAGGVVQPTAVFTTAAETQFRVELQLVDPNGDTVASNQSADVVLTIDERYTVTVPITYAVASYTGYSVRAMLYALVDTVWVPQGSLQTYFDMPATAARSGTGSGTVTSTPAGISCGVTCTAYFDYATVLTYTAVPTSGSKFTGWSGACSGTGACVVTLTAELPVTATFELKSTDAYLTALNLSAGTPSPAVVSTTTAYTATVGRNVASLQLTPTLSSQYANYTITLASGPCVGNVCSLAVGANRITITVTAEDGATTQDYVLTVTRLTATDAQLTALDLSPGTLAPVFVSSTTSYTAEAPNGTTQVQVTATTSDVRATVAYASSAGGCQGAYCSVAAPTTWITVTVTAEDGTTTRQYFIEITVADANASNDASLIMLDIEPGALAPAFVSTTTSYAANVPNGTTQVLVTTTVNDANATVAYASSAGGCQGAYCSVAAPKTWITVTVTAEDGTTTRQYFIEITVADANASNDASLIMLDIEPGALAPAFVSTTTQYEAVVPNGTTQVLVTATVNDANATVGYASSAGGCQGAYCSVAAPKTWITVTVTAEDGATTRQYFIEITVADANASNDAHLMNLAIDPGTLAPVFVSTTTQYEAVVPNETEVVTVTATPSDLNAVVTYAALPGMCQMPDLRQTGGFPAIPCTMQVGVNVITVTVTNGDVVQEYVITITRAAPLTTIDRVWPGTGLPEGGMPVQIFGTGFAAALTVTVGPYTDGLMIDVPFVRTNDGQIDFVMPAGVAGQRVSVTVQTANSAQTAVNAFTYVEPQVIEFEGETGGVFTTTDGVVVTIPPQGVSGSFFITMTPLPPEPGVPGNVLMYSFRLDAVLNGTPLATLTNPVTIKLPIDENIFAIADGERPWLYSWTADGRPQTAVGTTVDGGQRLVVGGRWILVRGQEYNAGTQVVTVTLRPMGVYALSTLRLRAYWFPLVPVVQ